jgi:hypothetical protein
MILTRVIVASLAVIAFGYPAYTQSCNLALKDGSKLKLTANTWANPSLYDPKFQKLSDAKKDEQILAFNQDVASGKIAPASAYPLSYTVKKSPVKDGGDQYTITTNIAGKDYSSYAVCKGDTLLFYRNLGVVEMPDTKGGTMGFTIQGAQVLPLKLKVGDRLPTYDDITILYPSTFDQTLKRTVMDQTSYTTIGDPMASSVNYKLRQVDVKVRETFNFSAHTIHYKNAVVLAEEDITISGQPYKAYVISSETWTKPTMTVSYETADEQVKKSEKKTNEIIEESLSKKLYKETTNELGYTVSYIKEWFVPQIGGIAKAESYDAFGGILGRTMLLSLE